MEPGEVVALVAGYLDGGRREPRAGRRDHRGLARDRAAGAGRASGSSCRWTGLGPWRLTLRGPDRRSGQPGTDRVMLRAVEPDRGPRGRRSRGRSFREDRDPSRRLRVSADEAAPRRASRRRRQPGRERSRATYFEAVAARDIDAMVACWAPGGIENIAPLGARCVFRRRCAPSSRSVRGGAGHAVRGARRGRRPQPGGRALARDRHVLRRAVPGHRADRRADRARGHRHADDRGRHDPAQRRLLRRRPVRAPDRPAAAAGQRRRAAHGRGLQRAHAAAAFAVRAAL